LMTLQFLISSCVHQSARPTVYEPKNTKTVFPYYVDGNPVAAVVTDNSIFQSAIEHTKLTNRHYMRVWVNYTNFSEDPILFDPMESFILTQTDKPSGTNSQLEIVYPSEIIHRVIKAEQAALITNAFIGMAEVITTTSTTFRTSTGVNIQRNDLDEKINIVNRNTSNRAQNIADNYDHFARNMNSILIKKNTVFPSRSVSGYVYFYIPVNVNASYSPDDYKYKLQSEIADIDVSIIFKPVLGY